ncbi:MAG: hypothetical protein DRQ62_15470 [Gammaproteobacteria bacterium]|nr:MAG: hypothetical protein DRQ62_15470 [Gammaproteobacteria bacterium]
MRITVKTAEQDKPAPPITDSLLSSVEPALQRGKSYLYESGGAYLSTVNMPLQDMINTGSLVRVHDYKYGTEYTGKVQGVAISIAGASININIDIESPA